MRCVPIVVFCTIIGAATIAAAQPSRVPAEAQRLKDQLTGDSKGKAADNPQCRLFTREEIARYVGEAVQPAENAAAGSGCMWSAKDGEGSALVQVVPSQYLVEPKLAQGYKPLPSVGTRGYVVPEMGGWAAGAVVGEDGIVVSVSGKAAGEATAVSLLQETIKRRKR